MKAQRLGMLSGLAIIVSLGMGYHFMRVHAHNERFSHVNIENLRGKKNLVDIAVIGSGPAGWDAALYGARTGYKVMVLTGPEPGGQLTKTTFVENWPGATKILGAKIIEKLEEQAKEFGAEAINDTLVGIDVSEWPYTLYTEDERTIQALSVVIATGASPRKLCKPGETEYWGKGVTTCAICDAPFYKGKKVVVVGGGDSAVEEALQLSAYAKEIIILVRGSEMRASHAMKQRLEAVPTISVRYNTEIDQIMGNSLNVTSVKLKNTSTGDLSDMDIDGVFLAIGHIPNTDVFKDVLRMNERGYIEVRGRSQETSVPGIFAAGDVEDDHYRQAGVAAAAGTKAALDAGNFLTTIGFNKQVAGNLTRRGAYFEDFEYEKIEIKHLHNLAEFQKVIQSDKPVFIDFYADYCPSCMQMLPAVESTASRYQDKVTFYKVDVNQAKGLVKSLRIAKNRLVPGSQEHEAVLLVPKVPCLLVYKNGAFVKRIDTALTRTELNALAQEVLAS